MPIKFAKTYEEFQTRPFGVNFNKAFVNAVYINQALTNGCNKEGGVIG